VSAQKHYLINIFRITPSLLHKSIRTVIDGRYILQKSSIMGAVCLALLYACPLQCAPKLSGLPLPRVASVRTNPLNIRVGPGKRFPIQWVMGWRYAPVIIMNEYDTWRHVKFSNGVNGWVHQSLLSGKRTAQISTKKSSIYRKPKDKSIIKAIARQGAIGKIKDVIKPWYHIKFSTISGWVHEKDLWGCTPQK
jgi:SH3-like domain-containing protein